MLTYFRAVYGKYEPSSEHISYRLNELFTQPITEAQYLVSTRHRAWVILDRPEYWALIHQELDTGSELFALLEDLGIVLTERNVYDVAALYAHRYSYLHRAPTLFILVPTNRCNMACVYCHAEAGNAGDNSLDMSEETAYRAVDFFMSTPAAHEFKRISIEFQGGECLLRWDLVRKVVEYTRSLCREKGYEASFSLVSNLIGVTDEMIADIHELGIGVSTSLDGPREINDQQRITHNGQGTYDLHMQGSQRLKAAGIRHGHLPTLTKHNLGHERELIDEYRRLGESTMYLRYVNQNGRADGASYDALGLTPDEYLGLWQRSMDYILELNQAGEAMVDRKTYQILGNMLDPTHCYMCLRRPCGLGIHQIVVDQTGGVYGCDQARSIPMFQLGNVHTDTYDDCFQSDTARLMRSIAAEVLPKCQACALSPYCGYCVARGLRQHGSPLPNVPEDFECQVYSKLIPTLFRYFLDQPVATILNRWK